LSSIFRLFSPLDKKSLSDAANLNGVAPAFQTYSAAPKWDAATFNALPALS